METYLFFSNNIDKIREIKSLTNYLKIKIVSPADFGFKQEPLETGKSFSENAKIKSLFAFNKLKVPSFADDSGICIEALNWKPNIYSKRFIENFKNKNDCLRHIIRKTAKTKKFRAYFKTSISLTLSANYHIIFEGRVDGTISRKIIGKHGFGYDPIFIPNGERKTFAQMKIFEKNLISHRSIALAKLINFFPN